MLTRNLHLQSHTIALQNKVTRARSTVRTLDPVQKGFGDSSTHLGIKQFLELDAGRRKSWLRAGWTGYPDRRSCKFGRAHTTRANYATGWTGAMRGKVYVSCVLCEHLAGGSSAGSQEVR